MKPADVTIENRRGLFVLRPETDRGWRGLEATVPGRWEAGALLVSVADVTPIVALALAAKGLEVADAPRYSRADRAQDGRG